MSSNCPEKRMSAETHEVLRKLPISELGAALAVAIIDNGRDREPIAPFMD